MDAVSTLTENIAPPGLKGLIVADTEVGSFAGMRGGTTIEAIVPLL